MKVKFTDIGEGLHEGKVAEIHVKQGQKIDEGDSLFSVETDKLTSDIPAPAAGIVSKIYIKEGEIVHVGDPIFDIDNGSGNTPTEDPAPKKEAPAIPTRVQPAPTQEPPAIPTRVELAPIQEAPAPSTTSGGYNFDSIVIGSGPGGYVLVEKLGAAGQKVAVIEKGHYGGVCLNVGCIPTKALLKSTKVFHYIKESEAFGMKLDPTRYAKFSWPSIQRRKDKIVQTLTKGVEGILRRAKAEIINGEAKLIDHHTIEVKGKKITGKNIIIATGSTSIFLRLPGFEDARDRGFLIDSTQMLETKDVPDSLVIIGGGVIGIEFACLFHELGTKVTIIEGTDSIIAPFDKDIRSLITKILTKRGITIYTNSMVKSISGNNVEFETNGEKKVAGGSLALLSVGRRANSIGADKIGVELRRDGSIIVDEDMRTNIPDVYAIGDVINDAMLAHVAYKHADIAANTILGRKPHLPYNRKAIPAAVYIYPEISSVGYTEKELKAAGTPYIVGTANNMAVGKAIADGEVEGFTKILIDKEYGKVLGVHMVNMTSSDIISEAVLAINLEATIYELCESIHPHPSTSEALYEAAVSAKNILEKSKK